MENSQLDTQNQFTKEATRREYSFEEGVEESMKRIVDLYKKLKKKRHIYVLINGSGINTGKTSLLGAIGKKLYLMGIPFQPSRLATPESESGEIIFDTKQEFLWKKGEDPREFFLKVNPNAPAQNDSYADLYIGIYRPDKKFTDFDKKFEPVADVLICNEYAKDDLGKYSIDNPAH